MTLYVLGTGFDKHHGIPSLYSDFVKWIDEQPIDTQFLASQVEQFFNREKRLWSEFEMGLGNYDFERIVENQFGVLPFMLVDIETKKTELLQKQPYIQDLNEVITRLFESWVMSLNTNVVKDHDLLLSDNDIFLSFNYTDTLERVYNIPDKRILHIHGSVKTNEPLVFGHNNYVDELEAVIKGNDFRDNNERIQRIYERNQLIKPVSEIIKQHQDFWHNLENVKCIKVMGLSCHSPQDIDYPYFETIRHHVSPDVDWYVGWHLDEEQQNAVCLLRHLGMPKHKRHTFRF